jgi:glutathione peroxidase
MASETARFRSICSTLAVSLAALGLAGGAGCDDGSADAGDQTAGVSASGAGGAAGQATHGSSGTGGASTGAGNTGGTTATEPPPGAGTGGTGTAGNGAAGTTNDGKGGEAGAGGADPVVSPACAKGGFYDFSAKDLGGLDDVSMCDFAGKVVLVVNVASKCGYTPQYKPLQALYQAYVDKGFVVLGFPSADFGNQEFANDEDISAFCTSTYGITFPMFSRIDVKGPNQLPLYGWLTKQPGGEGEITWNFNKFLLDRHGVFVQRFDTAVSPDSAAVTGAVEAELAKP